MLPVGRQSGEGIRVRGQNEVRSGAGRLGLARPDALNNGSTHQFAGVIATTGISRFVRRWYPA